MRHVPTFDENTWKQAFELYSRKDRLFVLNKQLSLYFFPFKMLIPYYFYGGASLFSLSTFSSENPKQFVREVAVVLFLFKASARFSLSLTK